MGTSVAQVSRYLGGQIPTKEARLADALMEWLETDMEGFGLLIAGTLLSSSEPAGSA